jgi:hypothetical protein
VEWIQKPTSPAGEVGFFIVKTAAPCSVSIIALAGPKRGRRRPE